MLLGNLDSGSSGTARILRRSRGRNGILRRIVPVISIPLLARWGTCSPLLSSGVRRLARLLREAP